jgi:hypothetical protein
MYTDMINIHNDYIDETMSDITINEVRRRLQELAKEHENDRGEKHDGQ